MSVTGGAAERCSLGQSLLQSVLKANTWGTGKKGKLSGDAQTVYLTSRGLYAFPLYLNQKADLASLSSLLGLAVPARITLTFPSQTCFYPVDQQEDNA